jgi:hypothetical protein
MQTQEEQLTRLRSEILRLSSIVVAAKTTYRVVSLERALVVVHKQALEELLATSGYLPLTKTSTLVAPSASR